MSFEALKSIVFKRWRKETMIFDDLTYSGSGLQRVGIATEKSRVPAWRLTMGIDNQRKLDERSSLGLGPKDTIYNRYECSQEKTEFNRQLCGVSLRIIRDWTGSHNDEISVLALSLSLLYAIQSDISLRQSSSSLREISVYVVDKDTNTWVSSAYKWLSNVWLWIRELSGVLYRVNSSGPRTKP